MSYPVSYRRGGSGSPGTRPQRSPPPPRPQTPAPRRPLPRPQPRPVPRTPLAPTGRPLGRPVPRIPAGLMRGASAFGRLAGWLGIAFWLWDLKNAMDRPSTSIATPGETIGTPCRAATGPAGPMSYTNGVNCGIPIAVQVVQQNQWSGPTFHAARNSYYYSQGWIGGAADLNPAGTIWTGPRGPCVRAYVGSVSRPLSIMDIMPLYIYPPINVPGDPLTLPDIPGQPRPITLPYPLIPLRPDVNPWRDPVESPTRRNNPSPRRGPREWPEAPPEPEFPPMEWPPTAGDPFGAPRPRGNPRARPRSASTPRGNQRKPPKGKERERKWRAGRGLVRLIAALAYAGTEAIDWVHALYWALPASARAATPWNEAGATAHMVDALWNHIGEIRLDKAILNVIKMEAIDQAVGRGIGRANQQASRMGVFGVGHAAGSIGRLGGL